MNKQNNQPEDLLKELLSDKHLLSPPDSFTAATLKKIELLAAQEKNIRYEPIISKKIWGIILALFAGILGYSIFSTAPIVVPQKVQFTRLAEFFAQSFSMWSLSPVLAWGIAAISVFFMLISVYYAKQYQPQK